MYAAGSHARTWAVKMGAFRFEQFPPTLYVAFYGRGALCQTNSSCSKDLIVTQSQHPPWMTGRAHAPSVEGLQGCRRTTLM